jgi:hypothetical protein
MMYTPSSLNQQLIYGDLIYLSVHEVLSVQVNTYYQVILRLSSRRPVPLCRVDSESRSPHWIRRSITPTVSVLQ